jgi:hypothetical protein
MQLDIDGDYPITFLTNSAVECARISSTGIMITGTGSSRVNLWSTNADAGSRNWTITTNYDAWGGLSIRQSNAINGNPYGATGTSKIQISAAGYFGIGVTPVKPLQVSGIIRTDNDVEITAAAKGVIFLDASTGHYWRLTINQAGTGALVTTDIGALP